MEAVTGSGDKKPTEAGKHDKERQEGREVHLSVFSGGRSTADRAGPRSGDLAGMRAVGLQLQLSSVSLELLHLKRR